MWAYVALAAAQLLGGYQQADMIRQSADVQSSVNDLNARFSDIDAHNAEIAGESEVARYQHVIDSTVGAERSAFAANNVSVNYGTAGDIQADTKIVGMVNSLEIQRQGRERALGYTMQGINTRLGGHMIQLQAQMDAAAAQRTGILNAAATSISGYARMQSTGQGFKSKSGSNSAPQWRMKPDQHGYLNGSPDTWVHGEGAWFFGDYGGYGLGDRPHPDWDTLGTDTRLPGGG